QPLSDQQGEQPPAYPILQIGLDSSKLHCRIQLRTHQMIELGLEQEVKSLIEKYGANLPLLQTLGYAEMGAYLRGEYTLQQAIAQTVLHTRQFAKRQRTWFRGVPEMEWFDGDSPDLLEQVWQRISIFLNEVKGSISPVTSGM
ncbi:MAG TPA: tRNA (adenosine(37)-N6)-dimethylallyltransferase MiaA, partial [Coleofasciculaceae cyanobacterium]